MFKTTALLFEEESIDLIIFSFSYLSENIDRATMMSMMVPWMVMMLPAGSQTNYKVKKVSKNAKNKKTQRQRTDQDHNEVGSSSGGMGSGGHDGAAHQERRDDRRRMELGMKLKEVCHFGIGDFFMWTPFESAMRLGVILLIEGLSVVGPEAVQKFFAHVCFLLLVILLSSGPQLKKDSCGMASLANIFASTKRLGKVEITVNHPSW